MRKSFSGKFVTVYPVVRYQCGLRAGDRLRLRESFTTVDADGNRVGKMKRAGGIWTVMRGAKEDPRVLWLRRPDGKVHTWADDSSIFKTFEKIGE